MTIEFTAYAIERMKLYDISKKLVREAVDFPDRILETYGSRKIFQKKLNGYMLRVVVQENEGIKIVITTYKSRSDRYEI